MLGLSSTRTVVALGLLAFHPGLRAQQPTPPAPPATPAQTAAQEELKLNPNLPTVFIVGDSTARNNADLGWGDHFAPFFDTTKVNIANRARAGRSSRSYYNEGSWARVLASIKRGDYVLFQMGHNDGGGTPESVVKDVKYRTSIHSLGDETASVPIPQPMATGPLAGQTVETVHTYGWYMRMYFAETRAKGATPILLTPTIRNIWKDGNIERDMGFREIDFQLAAAEHVPLIDMATVEANRLQALGPEKTALLFPIDHTHSSALGAEAIAHDVTVALRAANSPVAAYLKPAN
jgi:lysophospholipase L1-like esterase